MADARSKFPEAIPKRGKMVAAHTACNLNDALDRTRDYLLSTQLPDGTWKGLVESDPRATAFYLNTIWHLGRAPDAGTGEMERYLLSEQLECGAWQAWPGGGPDIDVTAVCVLALEKADTERGQQARMLGQKWLCSQPLPDADTFWKGFLALNGTLDWVDLPYLTPRLVTNPDWLHPNIYDFSFLRIAIVCASLLQTHMAQRRTGYADTDSPRSNSEHDLAFAEWKRRWIAEARKPLRGILPFLCEIVRVLDRILPIAPHKRAAIDWLLMRQESDGSFFSSVHMTSIAVLTLHHLDASSYQDRIEAGIDAMRKWQMTDERGRRQQFTDSTNWDTILAFDLLQRLGVPLSHGKIQRARAYLVSCQSEHLGDWSHRIRNPSPGGWGFQRVGKWYPDNDDTVMVITALLDSDPNSASDAIATGVSWLLAMQSSDGGWASWDRNDRPWIRIPNGGPWFARDLACPEITARILVLLSRIVRGEYRGFDDLVPAARTALRRGASWLKRQRQGGVWYGRWFTHYLYGTCHALEAYRELRYADNEPGIQEALSWLLSVANADGGFGEAPDSGREQKFVPAPSTPFHTACALIALIHAGASHQPVAQRAATWLLDNQAPEGGWTNSDFFAAGIPGLWYANFTLTPTYFAAKSLLLFKQSWFPSETKCC
jgi:squalene-hopene/tetraprenyl-beta-curcumene cyclase